MNTDQPPTNPKLYEGEEGRMTMAVFEFLDYMKEYFPLTPRNVDAFEKGSQRYIDKIEKMFQKYWESLPEPERKTIGAGVAKLLDRFTKGTRSVIAETRRHQRLTRAT